MEKSNTKRNPITAFGVGLPPKDWVLFSNAIRKRPCTAEEMLSFRNPACESAQTILSEISQNDDIVLIISVIGEQSVLQLANDPKTGLYTWVFESLKKLGHKVLLCILLATGAEHHWLHTSVETRIADIAALHPALQTLVNEQCIVVHIEASHGNSEVPCIYLDRAIESWQTLGKIKKMHCDCLPANKAVATPNTALPAMQPESQNPASISTYTSFVHSREYAFYLRIVATFHELDCARIAITNLLNATTPNAPRQPLIKAEEKRQLDEMLENLNQLKQNLQKRLNYL